MVHPKNLDTPHSALDAPLLRPIIFVMQDPFDFDLESRPYSDLFSPEDFSVDPFNLPETPKEQKAAPAPATAKPTAQEEPAFDFSQDPFADSGFDFSQEPATGKESAKPTPTKPKEDRSLLGEFGAGLARGVDTTQAMGYGLAALAGDLIGIDSLRNWGGQGFARNMQEAQENAASVRFLDISEGENFLEDTGNFIRWAAGGLGELAPTIAATIASGGAGGVFTGAARAAFPKLGEAAAKKYISRAAIKKFGEEGLKKVSKESLEEFADQAIKNLGTSAGVLASSVGMNTGEIYGNFIDPQTGEINEDSTSRAGRVLGTIGGGMLAGALDSLIPAKLFGKANLSKDDVIRNALRKIPTSQRAAKAAGEILLNTTVEGTTEAAQELISEAVGVSVDSIKDWDWDSLRPELIEAFALGALGGSVMTAPVEAAQAVREIALAPQIENRLFSIANDRLTASKGTEFTDAAPDVKAAMLKKEQEFVRENYVELRDKEIADRDTTITDLADARLTRQMGEEYTTADEETKKGLLEDEKEFIVNNTGVVQEEEIAAQNEERAAAAAELERALLNIPVESTLTPEERQEFDEFDAFAAVRPQETPAAPAEPQPQEAPASTARQSALLEQLEGLSDEELQAARDKQVAKMERKAGVTTGEQGQLVETPSGRTMLDDLFTILSEQKKRGMKAVFPKSLAAIVSPEKYSSGPAPAAQEGRPTLEQYIRSAASVLGVKIEIAEHEGGQSGATILDDGTIRISPDVPPEEVGLLILHEWLHLEGRDSALYKKIKPFLSDDAVDFLREQMETMLGGIPGSPSAEQIAILEAAGLGELVGEVSAEHLQDELAAHIFEMILGFDSVINMVAEKTGRTSGEIREILGVPEPLPNSELNVVTNSTILIIKDEEGVKNAAADLLAEIILGYSAPAAPAVTPKDSEISGATTEAQLQSAATSAPAGGVTAAPLTVDEAATAKGRVEANTANQVARMIPVVHYSPKANLDTLVSELHGTGKRGVERERKAAFPDIYQDRVYVGLPGYKKETGLGSEVYNMEIDAALLYDIVDDPETLLAQSRAETDSEQEAFTLFEKKVKERGYLGISSPTQNMATIFTDIPTNQPLTRAWWEEQAGRPFEPQVVFSKRQFAENARPEIERVQSTPIQESDGATFNIDGTPYTGGGIAIGISSQEAFIPTITPQSLANFASANLAKLQHAAAKVGIYKFAKDNNGSYDLSLIVPLSMEKEALELAKYLRQESIYVIDTGKNIKTGFDGKNPRTVSDEEFFQLADKFVAQGESDPDVMQTTRGKQTDTPEFKAWFGDSKVVDENGEPLVVYHGTGSAGFDEFEVGGRMAEEVGIFFSSSPDFASDFAARISYGSKKAVYPVYVKLENPLIISKPSDTRTATEVYEEDVFDIQSDAWGNGHDGIIVKTANDTLVIAFDETQVKSATGNRGTFDPNDPNILRTTRGTPRISPELSAEYMRLAQDPEGNAERLQEIVQEVARSAGYNIKLWHSTDQPEFFTFDPSGRSEGGVAGIWGKAKAPYLANHFSSDREFAESVVGWKSKNPENIRSFEVFIKADNIFDTTANENLFLLREDLIRMWMQSSGEKEILPSWLLGFEGEWFEEANEALFEADPIRYKEGIKSFLEEHGYDSFMPGTLSNLAVFDPSQIKSADPVVYDDNGQVVPLEARFDPTQDDIRYTTRPEASPLAVGLPDTTRLHQIVNNSIKAGRLLGFDIPVRNPDTANPDPRFRGIGGIYNASQRTIDLVLSEVVDISSAITSVHEVIHEVYGDAPEPVQRALLRWMQDIPEGKLLPFTDPRHTDPRLLPDNPNNLPEGVFQIERLVDSLAQYGVQQDVAEGIIRDLIRILKDLYYRAAMAIGEALNRPIEVTARAWAENKVQAVIAGQSPSFSLIDALRGRQYSRLAYNTQVYNTDGTFNLKLQNGVLVLPRVIGDDAGTFLANMAVHEENANQALLKTQLATQRTGEAAAQYEQNQRVIRMAELDVEYFEALDQGDQEAAARVVAEAQSLTEDAAGQPDPETVVRGEGGRILAPSERFNVEVFFNTQRGVGFQQLSEEYMRLAQDPEGNAERLQEIVQEVARGAGYTIKAYHGTPEGGFVTFDTNRTAFRGGAGNTADPNTFLGAHFAEEESVARRFMSELYGGQNNPKNPQLYGVYLRIENPLGGDSFVPQNIVATRQISIEKRERLNEINEELKKLNESLRNKEMEANIEGDTSLISQGKISEWIESKNLESRSRFPEDHQKIDRLEAERKSLDTELRQTRSIDTPAGKPLFLGGPRGLTTEDQFGIEALSDIPTGRNPAAESSKSEDRRWRTAIGKSMRKNFNQMGYDAIAYENAVEGGVSIIIPTPSQIKSADPVVYDDNGDIIPLDRRFDVTSDDIRYTTRGTPFTVDYEGNSRDQLIKAKQQVIRLKAAEARVGIAAQNQIAEYLAPVFDKFPDVPREKLLNIIGRNDPISEMQTLIRAYAEQREIILGDLSDSELETVLSEEGAEPTSEITYDDLETEGQRTMFKDSIKGAAINYPEKLAKIKATLVKDAEEGQRSLDRHEERYNTTLAHLGDVKVLEAEARKAITAEFNQLKKDVEKNSRADGADGLIAGLFSALYQSGPEIFPKRFQQLLTGLELDDNTSLFLLNRELMALDLNWDAKLKDIYPEAIQKIREAIAENPDTPLSLLMSGPQFSRGDEVIRSLAENDLLEKLRGSARLATMLSFAKKHRLAAEALAAAQADAQTKQQMMEDLADLRVRNTQDQIEELKALVRNRSPLTQSARDRLVISLADQKKEILAARKSVQKMEEQGPILDAARGAAMRHYDRVTKDLGISAYWQLLDGAPVPTEINMDARPEDVLNGTNDGSKIVKLDLRQNSLAANSRLDLSLDVQNKAVEIKKYLALHKNDEAFADTYAYRELTRMADAMAENSLRSDFTVVAKGGMRDGMRSVAGIAAKTGTVGGRTVEQMSKGYDRLIQSYNKFEVDGAAVSGLRARALKASKMRSSDHFSDMYSTAMAILDNEVVLTGKRALDAMVETLKGNPSYREALSYPDAEKLFTEYVTRNMEMGGRAMEIRAENGLLVREKIGDREIFRDHLNRGWGATAARVVKDFPYTLINNAISLNPGLMLVDGPLFLKTEVDEEGNVTDAETMEEFGARLKQVFDGTHNLKENVIDQILLNVAKDRFPHPQNKDVKLSNYEMRLAYDSANGDVAGMIQYLADSYGVPVAEYANEFMGAIESLMSKALAVGASKETPVGNVKIAPDLQSKYGSDARVGDDFPPLWVKYMEYGELQNSYIVRQIAAEAMFGRDFSKLETAVNQMAGELESKATTYKLALDKARNADTLKVDLKSVKKDLGKDYEDFKAAYELIEKGGFKPNSVLNAITSIIQSPETTFKLGALEELHSFIITGMLQGWETSLKQLSQIYMTTAAFRAVSRFNVLDPFINLFRTAGAFANWPLNFFGMEPFRVPFADRIIAENLHELQDSVKVGNTFKEIGISGHFSREDGARFSQMARGARAVVSRWSLRPKGEFLFPGFTLFPFRAFNQISMIVGTSDIMTKMEKLIKRANQYLIENPDKQTIDLRTITAKDLGYKNRLLGLDDATFWDNFMDAMYSYGVTLDQIVATYNAEKSQGLSGMDAKMVRTAHSMSKNFFSSESGLSTRPTIAQKSGLGRASFSLLGWSIQTGMYFIDGLMGRKITGEKRKKFADRLTSSIAAQKAYMFHLMPLAVLASMLFDEWDEEIEGKKSDRRPLLGAPNPTEFGLSVLERVGAMGPFGIVGDLGNSIANIGTGKPALSFDERVVWAGVLQDWQQLVSTAISTEAYKNPSNLTYNQFLRPAMQSLGLGSVLSNGQVINNLLGLNNAESRTATRINTNNALRGAGRVTGLEVRSFGAGGYARSVPYTPHVTNMILSAMSNDGRQFRESYNLAVEQMMKFKDVPRGEAEDRVGRSYAQRHPLKAVFKTTPTSGEYKAMLESMSPDLRQSVEVSLNNFNRWGETIGVKPYRGKGSSKKEGKKKLASGTEALSFEEQLNQQLTSRYSL